MTSLRGEARTLIRLSGPAVGGQVGGMLLGVVDTVMLGRYSADALAAEEPVEEHQPADRDPHFPGAMHHNAGVYAEVNGVRLFFDVGGFRRVTTES
jgi:hypothetical protein